MKGVRSIIQKSLEEGLSEDQILQRLKDYGYSESYVKKVLSGFKKRPSEKFLFYVLMQLRSLPDDIPKKELEKFLKTADIKGTRAVLGFIRTAKAFYRSKATIEKLTGIKL